MQAKIRLLFLLLLGLSVLTASAFGLTEERVNQQFDAAPGGNLVVDVDFGSIQLTGTGEGKVVVEAYRKIDSRDEAQEKEFFSRAPITVTQEGNIITVRARRAKDGQRWNWSGNISMDARYTIRVPKNFNADLRTSGGAVAASGIEGEIKADTSGGKMTFAQIRGPLDARTRGGGITLESVEGPQQIVTSGGEIICSDGRGTLNARTNGGSVAVSRFAGDVEVRTNGGSLKLEEIHGAITGRTAAGSIAASLIDPVAGDVRLDTSAGSIEIAVPANAGFNVEAKTSMGKVRTEIPMLATRSDDDRLIGTLNGGGKSLVLRASLGSIKIRAVAASAVQNR